MKQLCIEQALHQSERGIRGGKMYVCAECGGAHLRVDVHADHIEPVEPIDREVVSWDEHIGRLFCELENMQCLCTGCHKTKTNEENEARRDAKD